MTEQGFYRTWKMRLQALPGLQRFQQVGIGASYPMLAYTDAGLHVRHFYHAADQIGPDTMMFGPARVLVTLAYETFDIVSTDFQPFDLPLFEQVEYTLTADERRARRPAIEHLEGLYDHLLATYPEAPGGDVVGDFAAALHAVVPPLLWPYYERLLPDLAQASQ